MPRSPLSLAVVVLLAAVALVAGAAPPASADRARRPPPGCVPGVEPGERTVQVDFAGRRYPVTVYLPATVPAGTRPALVLNLHGTSSTGTGQLRYSDLAATADTERFAVVAPSAAIASGSGFAWNVPGVGSPPAGARDDVGFLEQVLSTARQALCADPARVYGTGYSGGGRMLSAFACARPDRLAAIAPVAGLRAGRPDPADPAAVDPRSCRPAHGVPVVAFHGRADVTNPYDGGGSELWRYSVPVAQQRWAAINGCAAGPVSAAVAPHVTRIGYGACAGGRDVVLYAVSDGGHTWPGTRQPSPGNGATTTEIHANSVMWRFFRRHRLPVS